MSGTLVMMCGIPGSGKSTYAKGFMGDKFKYVSRDEIRFATLKPGDYYFKNEKKVYSEFCNTVNDYLGKGYNVIADATFINNNARAKFLAKIANKPNYVIAKVIDTPPEICLERNAKREGRQRVPDEAIINMYNNFTYPTKKEGFDEIEVV